MSAYIYNNLINNIILLKIIIIFFIYILIYSASNFIEHSWKNQATHQFETNGNGREERFAKPKAAGRLGVDFIAVTNSYTINTFELVIESSGEF